MRVLVTGATGQLGRALVSILGDEVAWCGGSEDLDVRDREAVLGVVRRARPDVVMNASAYNNVDTAETEPVQALSVNAAGPAHLAGAARECGALLVHISTDYVFDGLKGTPYTEEDCPSPRNAYGVSKRAGELMVLASGCEYLLVRTSGLFGAGGSRAKGGSFIERIQARARAGSPLSIVADQVFSPTYAPDLAKALRALVERGARGIFHVTNSGSCSWYTLAVTALGRMGLGVPVEAISSRDLPAPARRPAFSVLSNERYRSLGLPLLRPWDEALVEFLSP